MSVKSTRLGSLLSSLAAAVVGFSAGSALWASAFLIAHESWLSFAAGTAVFAIVWPAVTLALIVPTWRRSSALLRPLSIAMLASLWLAPTGLLIAIAVAGGKAPEINLALPILAVTLIPIEATLSANVGFALVFSGAILVAALMDDDESRYPA